MKKSIVALSFFMLFIAIASFVVGCGSDKEKGNLTDILIAEKWCESEKGDPEMTFYSNPTNQQDTKQDLNQPIQSEGATAEKAVSMASGKA